MLFGEENVRAIQLPSMSEMNDEHYVKLKKLCDCKEYDMCANSVEVYEYYC